MLQIGQCTFDLSSMLLTLYTTCSLVGGKHPSMQAFLGCKNLAWRLTPETTFNLGNNCMSYALEEINEISRHVTNIKLKVTL